MVAQFRHNCQTCADQAELVKIGTMKNIVVIEDDKDVIDVVRYFLEKEQYRVHVAQDGLSGIELSIRIIPSLILLDVMLPKMNGMDVCRKLRADGRLNNVPIIMVTAKGEVTDKIRGLEIGADDYVTKPFSPHELVARVKANLRRREGKFLSIRSNMKFIWIQKKLNSRRKNLNCLFT
jgi:DNA-binding response OmpR family regulator